MDKPATKYGVAKSSRTTCALRDPHMNQKEPISVNQDHSKVMVKHVVLAYSVTKSDSRPWGHILTISLGFSHPHASISLRDSFHVKGSMSS